MAILGSEGSWYLIPSARHRDGEDVLKARAWDAETRQGGLMM
jgi:hypothetical protein